jgi:uncharacterized membrane protein
MDKNYAAVSGSGENNITHTSIIVPHNSDEIKYIEHIFGDRVAEGYIYVAHIPAEGKIIGRYFQYPDILDIISDYDGQDDIYISPNTFYVPRRKASNIRHFRTLYIDLDIEKYGKAETVYMVYMLADSGTFPTPTMIVDSGRGIHIYWRIDDAPAGAIWTWQSVEKYLCESLRDIGADPAATDPARLLRLPGTRNSRNGTACKIMVINDIRYNLAELAEKYIHSKPKNTPVKEKSSCAKIGHIYNPYSLHLQRAQDIETLCQVRGWDVTGYRNSIIHMYTYFVYASCRDEKETHEKVYKLNQSFTKPIRASEVDAVVRCIISGKKQYNYKNETIVGLLDITLDEQKHMRTIISREEKYRRYNAAEQKKRRNENGKTPKQVQKEKTVQAVIELAAQGLTQKEIAASVGVSRSTISRILSRKKST